MIVAQFATAPCNICQLKNVKEHRQKFCGYILTGSRSRMQFLSNLCFINFFATIGQEIESNYRTLLCTYVIGLYTVGVNSCEAL